MLVLRSLSHPLALGKSVCSSKLRHALMFSHLYWGNTFGMRCMLARNRPSGSFKNRAARAAAMVVGRLAAS